MNTTKRSPLRRARSSNGTKSSVSLPLSAAEKVLGLSLTSARDRHSRLTGRERQVASLMGEGRPNREIAAHLGISPKTLDIHRANVMHKLEAATSARVANLVNLLRLAESAR
jgi:FixJ family two-component response regulator